MQLGIIVAIIGSTFAIVGVIIAMFFWVRSESNSDRHHFQTIIHEDRKDILNLIRAIELEIKDFHIKMINLEKK